MSSRGSLIQLCQVSRSYAGDGGTRINALRSISLEIDPGEFICITGPSGSGKSTLFNILGCLEKPESGTYRFAEKEVGKLGSDGLAWMRRRAFGFVFQNYNLLETATVQENIQLPGRYVGMTRRQREDRVRQLLARLGLEGKATLFPSELSGGEQQRAAIARALMNDASIILADEPTAALDKVSGERVLRVLEELAEQGRTVILISHSAEIAARAKRRIELLDGRVTRDVRAARTEVQPFQRNAAAQESRAGIGVSEALRGAWDFFQSTIAAQLRRRRTRMALLGIALGAWMIPTVIGAGNGVFHETIGLVNRMGLDTIQVSALNPFTGVSASLSIDDIRDIEKRVPNVRAVSPSLGQRMNLQFGPNSMESYVEGFVDLGSKAARSSAGRRLDAGDYLTEEDDAKVNQVAVIASTVRDRLFPSGINPIGQQILIDSQLFRVKGTLNKMHGMIVGGSSAEAVQRAEMAHNNRVFVPFNAGAILLFGKRSPDGFAVFVDDPGRIGETAGAVRDFLLQRGVQGLMFSHPGQEIARAARARNQLWIGLGAIAGATLLAAALGVMAIMLMSVSERTREIGIRVAVGARDRDLFRQFLLEAIAMTAAGGFLGLSASVACLPLLELFGVPLDFSFQSLVPALLCVVVLGTLAGLLPAKRAASLNPVAALASD